MTQYIATESFYAIGVDINRGDIITIITNKKWNCSSQEGNFYGDIVQSGGSKLTPYFSKSVEERVVDKVKEMYARQPYVKKLTGQTEEVKDRTIHTTSDWSRFQHPFNEAFLRSDYLASYGPAEVECTPMAEESFNFLTR